jgi:diguanylate cyclase (GGDEF)-like protein
MDSNNQRLLDGRGVTRYATGFVVLVSLLAAGLLFLNIQSRHDDFLANERLAVSAAVSNTVTEISTYIQNARHLAGLFVPNNISLLRSIAQQPADKDIYGHLKSQVSAFFPEAHEFTVADSSGAPLLPDVKKHVGNGCRKDIRAFAQGVVEKNEIFIHSNPEPAGYHFDVLSMIGDMGAGSNGVFFVSLRTEILQRLLKRGQLPHHQLMLVRQSGEGGESLIDLTQQGPAPLLNRNKVLSPAELQRVAYSEHVPGTRWRLLDLPAEGYYQQQYQQRVTQAILIWSLLVTISALLVIVIYREENNRMVAERALIEERNNLERHVDLRTAELQRSQEKLTYQATHDSLTGLVNRAEFERRLRNAIDTVWADKSQAGLLYLDLDQFKIVNDTCGHMAGDELLRQISNLMRANLRGSDVLARLGGDEFAIIVESCSPLQTLEIAENLRREIRDHNFAWEGRQFEVGVSIGIVPINAETERMEEVLSAADSACYAAKEDGRNRVHLFKLNDEELERRRDEMYLAEEVHRAQTEGRLSLYAQPIFSLTREQGPWYELLVRIEDRMGRVLSPSLFIAASERFGKVTDLDRWVIFETLSLLEETHGRQTRVNINLSGQSLADHDLCRDIARWVGTSSIETSRLCFEITETAAIGNFSKAVDFVGNLRELGFRFALDDFGSGLCSFSYLKNLDVDYLKIDGNIVRGIHEDPTAHSMVEAILGMARALEKPVVAEYVENADVLARLVDLKVDYAQGFHFGRPQPFDPDSFE